VLRRERESGSIAVGKAADLIVLDRDVRRVDPMALHDVRVLLTLLDGKAVYRDPAFEEASPAGRMSH
jgi:predicted amidohydrolase YtcJ